MEPAGLRAPGRAGFAHPKLSVPGPALSSPSGLQVSLQTAPADSPDPGLCLGLLSLDSVETAQL